MSARRRTWTAVLTLCGLALMVEPLPARAQMAGMRRSLGGYGAATIGSYYRNQGGPLIPYAGGQGGFIPYEGIEARQPAEMLTPRQISETPIGGVKPRATPIGGASRMQGPNIYQPLNIPGGFGLGSPAPATRRYGPGFGSPFRQPPRLGGG